MRWRLHRTPAPAGTPPDSGSDPPGGAREESHHSPGLKEALARVREGRHCSVLDLGPAMNSTIQYLSRFGCRLRVVDLQNELAGAAGGGSQPADRLAAAISRILPDDLEAFDLTLAWDVFDHLDPEPARVLAARLLRLCRHRGRLFALTASQVEMLRPGTAFAIRDESTLLCRPGAGEPRRRRLFNPGDFERLLGGFRIESSCLWRSGMREWVAARAEEDPA